MIVTPKSDTSSSVPSISSAQSARERAINMLTQGSTAQEHPVPNPTSVSPEEMSAVVPPSEPKSFSAEDAGQKLTTESVEAPKSEEVKPAEEPLSSQFAQLARKEKAIRAKAMELKAQEAAIKAKEAEIEAKFKSSAPTPSSLPDRLKSADPKIVMEALDEMGLSYDDLSARLLNAPTPEALAQQKYLKSLEDKIAALEEAQNKSVKSFEEQQKQQYQQAVNQIKNEAKSLVSSGDEFETIRETGSIDDVVELIERTFKEDGVLLTVQDACNAVEEHLVEEAMKIARLAKIQQRLAPKPTAPKVEAPKQEPVKQPQLKTLTNSVSSSRPLTAKERAILAFKGELK